MNWFAKTKKYMDEHAGLKIFLWIAKWDKRIFWQLILQENKIQQQTANNKCCTNNRWEKIRWAYKTSEEIIILGVFWGSITKASE